MCSQSLGKSTKDQMEKSTLVTRWGVLAFVLCARRGRQIAKGTFIHPNTLKTFPETYVTSGH